MVFHWNEQETWERERERENGEKKYENLHGDKKGKPLIPSKG
jgi:hypothetical protein